VKLVLAAAAEQMVRPGASTDGVVAVLAVELILAAFAKNVVGVAAAPHPVGVAAAPDHVDAVIAVDVVAEGGAEQDIDRIGSSDKGRDIRPDGGRRCGGCAAGLMSGWSPRKARGSAPVRRMPCQSA